MTTHKITFSSVFFLELASGHFLFKPFKGLKTQKAVHILYASIGGTALMFTVTKPDINCKNICLWNMEASRKNSSSF